MNEPINNFDNASNDSTDPFYDSMLGLDFEKYVFFAICSALFGIPSNILLLVILLRIGLFARRQSLPANQTTRSTGSFERFLFEIVLIDTVLLIYHFIDNFLSYIHNDRSTGRYHLIHISDFCCKLFTYIAKTSVLLTTWLLLFLIINRLILTIDYNENHRSIWNRGLYYVNAKYSTVFLIFIFSVYNIYPIEVLKYQKKEEVQDYREGEGVPGVCSMASDPESVRLSSLMNYAYNIVGLAMPCVAIFILSMLILSRTCCNTKYSNRESRSFHYIAAAIGIFHSMFNIPARFSDIFVMMLPSSALVLSYGYKGFICILISQRFRQHAKSILCFLIENQYGERPFNDYNEKHSRLRSSKNLHRRRRHKKRKHHCKYSPIHYLPKHPHFNIRQDDTHHYKYSESTYWIRPYFTRNEPRINLRPCGLSSSCHQLSIIVESKSTGNIIEDCAHEKHERIYVPSPERRLRDYQSSSACLLTMGTDGCQISTNGDTFKQTNLSLEEEDERTMTNNFNYISSSYLY